MMQPMRCDSRRLQQYQTIAGLQQLGNGLDEGLWLRLLGGKCTWGLTSQDVYSAHPQALRRFSVTLVDSRASGAESSAHSSSAASAGDCTSDALRCVGCFCSLAACCTLGTAVLSCMQQEVDAQISLSAA